MCESSQSSPTIDLKHKLRHFGPLRGRILQRAGSSSANFLHELTLEVAVRAAIDGVGSQVVPEDATPLEMIVVQDVDDESLDMLRGLSSVLDEPVAPRRRTHVAAATILEGSRQLERGRQRALKRDVHIGLSTHVWDASAAYMFDPEELTVSKITFYYQFLHFEGAGPRAGVGAPRELNAGHAQHVGQVFRAVSALVHRCH